MMAFLASVPSPPCPPVAPPRFTAAVPPEASPTAPLRGVTTPLGKESPEPPPATSLTPPLDSPTAASVEPPPAAPLPGLDLDVGVALDRQRPRS